ncbi:unnamed protein product [Leuciscus chuanchicus]
MFETLQLPALQIQGPADGECNGSVVDPAMSSSSLRRKRFKMRRMKNVMSEKEQEHLQSSGSKEYLQLPSIEITPSSDEDAVWSSCSTPSASPQRRRSLLRKWLRGGEKKEHGSESSSQQSSLQSSHEEETTRYLSPNTREDRLQALAPKLLSETLMVRLASLLVVHMSSASWFRAGLYHVPHPSNWAVTHGCPRSGKDCTFAGIIQIPMKDVQAIFQLRLDRSLQQQCPPPCGSELSNAEGAGLCGSSRWPLGHRAKHFRTGSTEINSSLHWPGSAGPLEPELLICSSPLRPPETQQGQRNMLM